VLIAQDQDARPLERLLSSRAERQAFSKASAPRHGNLHLIDGAQLALVVNRDPSDPGQAILCNAGYNGLSTYLFKVVLNDQIVPADLGGTPRGTAEKT
jgi:hypothetical protein